MKGLDDMEPERINSQTAAIHLPVIVEEEDAPKLRQLLQALFEEGMRFILVVYL